MAFRIHDSVVRGEIDNREKGIVRGRIWVADRAEPVVLELTGNAWGDVAGCLLTFENPGEKYAHPHLKSLQPLQRGTAGDITASRKVRVFDIPIAEAYPMLKRGEKPPEHMANSIYVEWYSETNGRVVIESADYQITVSPPAWKLSETDEIERAKNAASGWSDFMQKLGDALEAKRHSGPEEIEEWNEFDYEKLLRESDARTDKYSELLDKYGDTPESEELIAKEMGWHRDDESEPPIGQSFDVDEMNEICREAEENPPQPDPMTEGIDWIRVDDGGLRDFRHPLQHRCHECVMAFWDKCKELGVMESDDEDLQQLIGEFQITSAKLAGALNSLAYGRDTHQSGFIVACLKRALNHLHKAQAGLENVAPKKLLPENVVEQTRKELFEIREGILRLMEEFREWN